jgi:hypothetical protein
MSNLRGEDDAPVIMPPVAMSQVSTIQEQGEDVPMEDSSVEWALKKEFTKDLDTAFLQTAARRNLLALHQLASTITVHQHTSPYRGRSLSSTNYTESQINHININYESVLSHPRLSLSSSTYPDNCPLTPQ